MVRPATLSGDWLKRATNQLHVTSCPDMNWTCTDRFSDLEDGLLLVSIVFHGVLVLISDVFLVHEILRHFVLD